MPCKLAWRGKSVNVKVPGYDEFGGKRGTDGKKEISQEIKLSRKRRKVDNKNKRHDKLGFEDEVRQR